MIGPERHRMPLEGGGDLGAALLKNGGAQDHEKPQGSEEGQGA